MAETIIANNELREILSERDTSIAEVRSGLLIMIERNTNIIAQSLAIIADKIDVVIPGVEDVNDGN